MPGPQATLAYAREAEAAFAAAVEHLTAASKRCLEEAERQSRDLDDNHVGTEHIVLGVMVADPPVAGLLTRTGITEKAFRDQLFQEPGPSPAGRIPLTPRAQMILGFARSAASGGGEITPRHLLLGVIAESRDWQGRHLEGPQHLEQAARAAGTDLVTLQAVLSGPK